MHEADISGARLVDAIAATVPVGAVRVFPLGQSGVILRFPEAVVAIDLYLSNHLEAVIPRPFDHRRLTRAPLDPAQLTDLDVILCSHEHLDHFDPPTIRTLRDSSPRAHIVVPASMADLIIGLDWPADRVHGTFGGDTIHLGPLSITSFGVPHETYNKSPETGHAYQGYVVSDGRQSVAHVGDSLADDQLAATLANLAPDLLCVPINGRDAHRKVMGFAGNMTAEEAVALVARTGARFAMPIHDDMFAQNLDDRARERFLAAAHEQNFQTVRPPVGGSVVID